MRACILMCSLLVFSTSLGKDSSTEIERLMSAEEYREAGLDKLEPHELEALNRWLTGYRSRAQAGSAEPGFDAEPPRTLERKEDIGDVAPAATKAPKVAASRPKNEYEQQLSIRTRIAGSFSGWRGKTRFKLENGEIWRQRTKGHYVYRAENPEVEIYENRGGFPMMRVIATGRSVGVSRVE